MTQTLTKPEKLVAGRRFLETVIREGIIGAPPRSADTHVRVEARAAVERGLERFSDAQLYDIVQRAGDAEPHCEVDTFFHALCNLKPFYTRPADV